MAKIILICGKLCSGKTTYANKLRKTEKAVILSSDEAVLRLFGHYLGADHDRIARNVNGYLMDLTVQIAKAGTNVILDWGFWTADVRKTADTFFKAHGISVEWHFVEVSEDVWHRNIDIRNRAVIAGENQSFLVDAGLLEKFESQFQPPKPEEMDIWYLNDWT